MNSPALTNFFGGPPASVVLRLVVISFIVGLFLVMFGFEPEDIIDSVSRAIHRAIEFGLTDLHHVWRVLATGALVVVPLWLVSRLMSSRGAR